MERRAHYVQWLPTATFLVQIAIEMLTSQLLLVAIVLDSNT